VELSLLSAGAALHAGCAVVAHGLDHVISGVKTVYYGQSVNTATSQLIQTTGLSSNAASYIDNGLSIAGTLGGAALARTAGTKTISGLSGATFSNATKEGVKEAAKKVTRKRFTPDPNATGAHTVFRRDPVTGKVTHYETYKPQTNLRDPKPWEIVKRFDGLGSDPHWNKVLDADVGVPHVHDTKTPGGIRPPEQWEIPH
jgi:hypothetical protein